MKSSGGSVVTVKVFCKGRPAWVATYVAAVAVAASAAASAVAAAAAAPAVVAVSGDALAYFALREQGTTVDLYLAPVPPRWRRGEEVDVT